MSLPYTIAVGVGTPDAMEYRWLGGQWVSYDVALNRRKMVFGPTAELLDEIRRLRYQLMDADELLEAWQDTVMSPQEVAELIERVKRDEAAS